MANGYHLPPCCQTSFQSQCKCQVLKRPRWGPPRVFLTISPFFLSFPLYLPFFLLALLLFLSPLSLCFAFFLFSYSKFRASYVQGKQCTIELHPQPLLILGTLGSAFLTKLPLAPQTAHYPSSAKSDLPGSLVSPLPCLEGEPHVV